MTLKRYYGTYQEENNETQKGKDQSLFSGRSLWGINLIQSLPIGMEISNLVFSENYIILKVLEIKFHTIFNLYYFVDSTHCDKLTQNFSFKRKKINNGYLRTNHKLRTTKTQNKPLK